MFPFELPATGARSRSRIIDLPAVARSDPRRAIAMLGGCNSRGDLNNPDWIPRWGEIMRAAAWEIIKIEGCFDSGAAGQTIPASVTNMCGYDLTVCGVEYTVRTPNAWPGSVLGPMARFFNKMQPDIDFTLMIKSYCPYVISADPIPLENIAGAFECCCELGLVLNCGACISATFSNCRPLLCSDPTSTDPNCPGEVPTNVVITLHTMRLPALYSACDHDMAINALTKNGILPKALMQAH